MKVLLAGAFGNLGFEILKVLVEHCGKPDSLREYRSGASAGYSVEDIEITYTKVNALGMDEKVTLKLNDKDSAPDRNSAQRMVNTGRREKIMISSMTGVKPPTQVEEIAKTMISSNGVTRKRGAKTTGDSSSLRTPPLPKAAKESGKMS